MSSVVSRRAVLAGGASALAVGALPVPVAAVSSPAPITVAWLVGDTEAALGLIRAVSEREAVDLWLRDHEHYRVASDPVCQACPGGLNECPLDLDVCDPRAAIPFIEATREPGFDTIADPTPRQWLDAGLSYTCHGCGEFAAWDGDPDMGAVVVDGVVFHGECLREMPSGEECKA